MQGKHGDARVSARWARMAMTALASSVMAACGGGGGGGGAVRADPPPAATPPPVVPVTPVTPVVSTPNPAYSKHLTLTNTQAAHAAGLTGAGSVIGVIDTGVNRNHPSLYPRVTANLTYVGATGNDLTKDDVDGHGTAIAQVAAGTPFGSWPGGVAPGATIASARIINDTPPADDGSGQGNEVEGGLGLTQVHQALMARGVRIMNNSWGGLYWTNPDATASIASEYRAFIQGNGGLVVFATGNESEADPSDMAALPSQAGPNATLPAADLERGWLAVAALDTDAPTQLASYSNACGIAMHYCLVAPGTVVVTGTDDGPASPTYWQWQGTSLATPQVSGAAALVWQAFPYFSNDLVRQTVLGTARDLGAEGVDAVFGHGLLDVGAAVRGPARLDWGNVTVDFAGSSTWSNDISGAGGIVKQGSGTLALTGTGRYQGDTVVQGGTLSFAATVPGDAAVSAGARLQLADAGVNGNLSNSGNVRVGGAAGSRVVGGNFVQSPSGVLEFQVGTPLDVQGTAQLAGGLQVFGIASGYVRSSRETVLTAGSGISGQFGSLGAGSGVFLEATLGYDPTRAWLDITRLDVTAAAAALGIAPAAVGAAVRVEEAFDQIDDGQGLVDGDFLAMAGALLHTADAATAAASLQSLSGTLHAAADAMTLDTVDMRRRALAERMDGSADGRGGHWFRALGGREARGLGVSEFDVNGWMAGREVVLGGNLVGGLVVGQAESSSAPGASDRSRDRQAHGQLYLGGSRDGRYALVQAGWGHYQRDLHRQLVLGSAGYGVDTDYAGDVITAGVEAGHRVALGRRAALTPYLGLDYSRLGRDGFAEAGAAGFGLQAQADHAERGQAIVGLRAEQPWQLGPAALRLRSHVEWQQVLAASGFSRQMRFVGIDAWAPLEAADAARSGGLFGLSLDADLSPRSRFSIGLDRRFGPRKDAEVASARYQVGF